MHFQEIAIHSPAPAELLRFYRDRLGLPSIDDVVSVGGCRLGFRKADGELRAPYHLAFNIPANKIHEAKRWVSERVRLLSDEVFDFESWNAEAVYFEDPDGNILELIARKNLENSSDAPFDSEQILEVSEFGYATDSPEELISNLERDLGLSVFSGDREEFTAVGDEHGLFIVVRPGREWLPTDKPAAVLPAMIEVSSPRAGSVRQALTVIKGVA